MVDGIVESLLSGLKIMLNSTVHELCVLAPRIPVKNVGSVVAKSLTPPGGQVGVLIRGVNLSLIHI